MAIYMKYTNPNITGDVTTEGFQGQIEIQAFSYNISRTVNTATGKGGNREASTPYVGEIAMSKELCSGSGDLLKEAYSGAGKADAVISFVRTDAGGGVPYLVYTLSNVMLSQHSTAGNSESRPQESFNLNFTKIETKITPQKVDGTAGTASITTYDLAAQKNT